MAIMRGRRSLFAFLMVLLSTAAFTVPSAAEGGQAATHAKHILPTATSRDLNGPGTPDNAASRLRPRTSNGISYHGGPIILGTTNAYVIWYGNWSSGSQAILTNLLSHVGGSPYFNINTTYYNGSNVRVTNSVALAGTTTDNYSQGKSLSDAAVLTVVSQAISSGRLPKDTNGLYFVLTAADVGETSGFLTQYCGWHDHATVSGSDVKFSFVGDASKNLGVCAEQTTSSPNGNPAADAMASVIAHELEETTTDPDLNAWFDTRGYENADKCAWTFGTTYSASNGSLANMKIGGSDYLIQRNWVNASGGYCALSY